MTNPPFRISVALLVLSCAFFVGGCSFFWKKKNDVPEATLPSWLGRVVMVDAAHRFALVDTGGPVRPAVGATVVTFSDKHRTSTLRVTEEARPPYLALEIVEGLPALEDKAVLDESRPAVSRDAAPSSL